MEGLQRTSPGYQQFKKELFGEMRGLLKPHGFAKYGPRFRCARPNGITCVIWVQSNRFGEGVTLNLYLGVMPTPTTAEDWKNAFDHLRWHGCLGQSLTDGWNHQHWIEPYAPDDARVTDGCTTLRWMERGEQVWHELRIPVPTYEQAKAEVCSLLLQKLLPLWEGLQTAQDYAGFCARAGEIGFLGRRFAMPAECRLLAAVQRPEVLLPQIDDALQFHQRIRQEYLQSLAELERELANSRRKNPTKMQRIRLNNYQYSIQRRDVILAEYEQIRAELPAQKEEE